jgi:hypothetical protein
MIVDQLAIARNKVEPETLTPVSRIANIIRSRPHWHWAAWLVKLAGPSVLAKTISMSEQMSSALHPTTDVER